MNYFQNGEGDGVIILVLAGASLILVLSNQLRGLWLTALCSLGLIAYTIYQFRLKMSQAKADMDAELEGNPFRGLADLAAQSVQLQWGWGVMIGGALLLIAAASMKQNGK